MLRRSGDSSSLVLGHADCRVEDRVVRGREQAVAYRICESMRDRLRILLDEFDVGVAVSAHNIGGAQSEYFVSAG